MLQTTGPDITQVYFWSEIAEELLNSTNPAKINTVALLVLTVLWIVLQADNVIIQICWLEVTS